MTYTDWYFMRCITCNKILGVYQDIDGHGTSDYCLDCASKAIDNNKVNDWKYGIGNFQVKKEYIVDGNYI